MQLSWVKRSDSGRLLWGIACMGAIAFALAYAGGFGQDAVNVGGLPLLWRFVSASLRPDLSLDFVRLAMHESAVTLAYAVCGSALSVILGAIGGLLASRVWWSAVSAPQRRGKTVLPRAIARALLAGPRAIHEAIWGLLFVSIFGLDSLSAILALAIPFGAITAKVFADILDDTPPHALNALLDSGSPAAIAILYGLLPQAFLNLLSYSFYRFECALRSAAVLGIIGAGGLGYQILLSLQSLRYEQLWTLFYASIVLNGTVDFASALLRQKLGAPNRLDLNARKLGRGAYRRSSGGERYWLAGMGAIAATLIPLCFWYLHPDLSKLRSARTYELLGDIGRQSFPLHLNGADLANLLHLSLQTAAMSVLAIAVAGLGAMLLAFPAAHNFFLPGGLLDPTGGDRRSGAVAWVGLLLSRGLLLIFRAIPAPIWALVCLFVFFPGVLPGAIALGIHNLGILGRLMAEAIENLDRRPLLALKAQGAPALLVFAYGVIPASLTRFVAYVLYRWEVCVRETVIVGLVGAGGLGRLLMEQLSSFDYRGVMASLLCLVVLTAIADAASDRMRKVMQ
ncbi:ABC transporter permease [Synechococcus sp. PCC 7336]|uniref:PhnE/PtxC family ABC transporter permease n=1 Tax=Synechococcus sp. PCC 7336 TaxID=195250 RepID=UPI00034BB736|nr:ABC transporter permease subunit [Synechococcus sp. PCC 7336]